MIFWLCCGAELPCSLREEGTPTCLFLFFFFYSFSLRRCLFFASSLISLALCAFLYNLMIRMILNSFTILTARVAALLALDCEASCETDDEVEVLNIMSEMKLMSNMMEMVEAMSR